MKELQRRFGKLHPAPLRGGTDFLVEQATLAKLENPGWGYVNYL
jgi:hypothetical protein